MPLPLLALLAINFAASAALSLLAPKPKLEQQKAAGLSEFDIPTATEDRVIPYVAGNVKLTGANITWYGDLEARPITQWIRTTLFGTGTRQQLGFRYNLGWEAALCYGGGVALKKILYDDKEVFSGNAQQAGSGPVHLQILKEDLFGGEGSQGDGGINWELDWYGGDHNQTVNPYLSGQFGGVYPAHRAIAYVVSQGPSAGAIFSSGKYVSGRGYIGKTPQLRPLAFYVERAPSSVNPSKSRINTDDCNPIEILYELYTNKLFGGGRSGTNLDLTNWSNVASTLYDEGFGLSVVWERSGGVAELIEQIRNTIDAVIYEDYSTRKLTIKLIRQDYNANTTRQFNRDNVLRAESFSTGSWLSTHNELRYSFTDRASDYNSVSDVVHELGNFQLRGLSEPASTQYDLLFNRTLAQKVALRDLRVLALPLARARLRTNRSGSLIYPGEVIRWTSPDYGFTDKLFRVTQVDYGRLGDGEVLLDVTEDIFTFGQQAYTVNPPQSWTPLSTTPQVAATQITLEQPHFVHKTDEHRAASFVAAPNGVHLAYDAHISSDGGSNYSLVQTDAIFTPVGTLYAAYGQLTADYDTTGFEMVEVGGLSSVFGFSPAEVATGEGLLYFEDGGGGGEFASFEDVTFNSGTGRYTFAKIWRGVLDTPPRPHASGSRVWVVGAGAGWHEMAYANAASLRLRHLTKTNGGVLALASAPDRLLTIAQRALKPAAPGYLRIGGSYTTTTHTGDVAYTWRHRNRTASAVVKQSDADAALESGATYTIQFKNESNTTLRTVTGLTGTSYTYTAADQLADNGGVALPNELRVELWSVNGALQSEHWQRTTTRI